VLDSSGNITASAKAAPNKKKYNIKKLDAKIKFGELKAGEYTFVVKAKNAKGWKTLINKKFTVE
jgi:hypothetical protein